ncbi:XRE family transcriptional regulator [Streptomyces sp. NPDC001414]
MTPSRPTKDSKAAREALRRRMADLGCSVAAIAQEMRVTFGYRNREAWRHAHGWSQQELADRIYELTSQQPTETIAADTGAVSRWERWPAEQSRPRRPTMTVLMAMASVYQCTVEDLLDMEDRAALPAGDLALLNKMAAVAPSGPDLVRMAADESLTWAHWAEGTNIGDFSLAALWQRTRSLAARYLDPASNPIELFRRTRDLRTEVAKLLQGHQPPSQTRDLYVIIGYLHSLLAWMSSDLGHDADAETQGMTAWLCAELADDDTLRAWVLSVRSKTAFWNGRLRDAIQHTRHAAHYRPTGSVSVLLSCQQADAWSQLGARDEAVDALAQAERARERMGAEQDPVGGLFSCALPRQENYAAAVKLRIDRPHEALAAADRGLALIGEQEIQAYGTLAQIHISRATAQLQIGEPEGAHEALLPVFALPPDQRLAPVAGRLTELTGALAPLRGGGRGGVGLRAAIEAFRVDSAPQRLALSPGHGSG